MADTPAKPRKRLTGEEQVAALKARLVNAQARLSKARRAQDTRIKVLMGALSFEVAKRDPQVARTLIAAAPAFFSRELDAKLMAAPLDGLRALVAANGTPGQKPAAAPVQASAPKAAASPSAPLYVRPGTFIIEPDTPLDQL